MKINACPKVLNRLKEATMKLTPFYLCHKASDAVMITAGGGFQLPLKYNDVEKE